MLSFYRSSLRWVLDNPTLTLVVLFLTVALNVVLIVKIPKGFFPQEDTGRSPVRCAGRRIHPSPRWTTPSSRSARVIKNDPAVANVIAFTGGNGATNTGFLFVALEAAGGAQGQRLLKSSTVCVPN